MLSALASFAREPFSLFLVIITAVLLLAVVSLLPPRKGLPPVVRGLPLVGSLVDFLRCPYELALRSYRKYGEIFTLRIFNQRMTFLVGPNASEFFFRAQDTQLDPKEVYKFSVPIFGKGVVYDVELDVRQEQFKFLTKVFRKDTLKSFVSEMQEEAETFFADKWGSEGVVDLRLQLAELIILTASRCLMGPEIRKNLHAQVAELFQRLDEGMLPITFFFPNFPIKKHWIRNAAREQMVALFSSILDARRANPDKSVEYHDALQSLMDARYKDGSQLTDQQIAGLMIALLFAGQHTSSVTSSWTGYFLMNNRHEIERVQREQDDMVASHGSQLDYDTLEEMTFLTASVKEALRIHPPLIFLVRKCLEDFSVGDYTVPAGDMVFISPPVSHRVESIYPSPESFEPDRFLPPRNEFLEKHRAAYVGFGFGRHQCLGENFAMIQIKTIWSVLLRKYDMELVDPFPTPDFTALVVGPKPCRIRYRRRVPIAS